MAKRLVCNVTDVNGKTSIGSICNSCDITFPSEADFKEHILNTIHNGPSNGTRNFKYRMSAKTAKSNLLKGAKREHINVDYKQGASNIDFSDGAWILTAFPEVLKWEKEGDIFSYSDVMVKVVDVKPGFDVNNKNVDYKVQFIVNEQKIVLHAYNGRQRLTVSGKEHAYFVRECLVPYFTQKIKDCAIQADKLNKKVITSLGPTVKRDSVRFKTSSLACNKCNKISKSIKELHIHMKAKHRNTKNLSLDEQKQTTIMNMSLEEQHQSTRNNSIDEYWTQQN